MPRDIKLLLVLIFFTATLAFAETSSTTVTQSTEVKEETKQEAPKDIGWPRVLTSQAGSKLRIYQPQIENWTDQKQLSAWTAVEFWGKDQNNSTMGTVKWEAQTSVAKEERMVKIDGIKIRQVNFPGLDQNRSREITTTLKELFPTDGLILALDRVLAALDKSAIKAGGVTINQNPPPIFYSSRPAFLLQFDGDPIISPIKDSDLKYVVNTNWDVIQDVDGKFYLRNDKRWFWAPAIDKEWKLAKKLPKSFETLPNDDNWKDVRAAMPPKNGGKVPVFFVSTQPAELIVTNGKPKLEKVGKSKLLWVKNTECDVFQMKRDDFYFLVSGRWFKAKKLEGPWTFATNSLPEEFSNIPRNHPRARVRASVPGTDEANEAVILAQIPQTITISKQGLQSPEVKYQGDPVFTEIKGTQVSYASNCSNDVLKVKDAYYLCYQSAWFQSSKPNGPWQLATAVPEEIYKIPSDSPMHHVTYVKIEKSDPESVTYSATSGYSGVSVSFGVAMWGTGWYYPPYHYYGGYYPVYYPYPHSYGSYAIYNSRTGAYGYGSTVAGPNGGLSRAATYNPNTGTYARGSAAWSGNEFRGQASAYNPRTGTSMQTRQGRNENGNWGSTKVQRGDDWAQRGHVNTDNGSLKGMRTSEGNGVIRGSGENGSGFVGKKGDDVYAGKDGNVYRKTEDGWQQHGENGWSDVNRPETRDQLDRESGARREGDRRVEQSSRDRSGSAGNRGSGSYGSGNRGSGSYGGSRGSYGGSRGGGGFSRGGGGRRR